MSSSEMSSSCTKNMFEEKETNLTCEEEKELNFIFSLMKQPEFLEKCLIYDQEFEQEITYK